MKFSVALCTYNGSQFLAEQLASLVGQTRPPDELIICDDCSSDNTLDILRAFAATAPFKVHLKTNEQNLGSTKNFEQAINLCSGDLIALCDQDDVWLSQKLARTESLFVSQPEVGAVFTDAEMVDENLRPLGQSLWAAIGFDEKKQQKAKAGQALRLLIDGNFATGATVAFREEYRDLVLPIPQIEECIHDAWIVLLISAVARLGFIDEPTMLYRRHPRQQVGIDPEDYEPASLKRDGTRIPDQLLLAIARQTSFAMEIDKCRELRDRLMQCGNRYDCTAALAQVESKLNHFETRNNMPREKLRRLPQVLRELLSLRYHSYSRGFKSAAKDLFV
ncbi:MAG TPA: glycosyltransferase family 2 protein [Pyrinomonadaceae bacterium]|nr:glycosyltransferase family 2 protein [Pyrinomonadaceae bacterium]